MEDDYLVFENVRPVDADGNVIESYDRLLVARDIEREGGRQRDFTPYRAALSFEKEDSFSPSFALTCNLLAAAWRQNDEEAVRSFLLQYKDKGNGDGWHAQNSVIDWRRGEIVHYPDARDFAEVKPVNEQRKRRALGFTKEGLRDCLLEEGLKDSHMRRYVRQLTGLEDPSILVDIGNYFHKPARVWVSGSKDAVRAAWLGCGSDNFDLDGDFSLSYSGATRRVRAEGAAREARQKISDGDSVGIEEVLKAARLYVSKHSWDGFEQDIRKLKE